MRRFLFSVMLVALATPAFGEPAKVMSGEHDGFTRLVFDFGTPVEWVVGRRLDGYGLHIEGRNVSYDLTAAFAIIGRSRLADITTDPATGDVQIGMACACHAMPFEFRPGIIVVDLKDGPPPKESSFENPLQANAQPSHEDSQAKQPGDTPPSHPATFDWLEATHSSREMPAPPPQKEPPDHGKTDLALPDPELQPLRDTLLNQLAQGASQGVVDMATLPADTTLPETTFPSAQIRIGNAPTNVTTADTPVIGEIGAQGDACVDSATLDVSAWGDESSPATTQIADLRVKLSGEFDKVNPETLGQAIRLQLYLGFGAEARQMVKAFDLNGEEAQILTSLGYLIDGDPDPAERFAGQAACDGPAALWALLSDPSLTKGMPVNDRAIRLAFAAMPLQLRKALGPTLSERFLALGNADAARALTGSITRTKAEPDGKTALMEASLDLHTGDTAKAEALAQKVLADPGQDHPEALIALTEARVAQKLPVSSDVVAALASFLSDYKSTPQETQLEEALMLARAASGEFTAAFEDLPKFPQRVDTVWQLAIDLAPDDTFLELAVLPDDGTPPLVAEETAAAVARRLASLGLATASAPWLAKVSSPDPLLIAEIALQNRDARAALQPIVASDDALASAYKVHAYGMLGEFDLQAEEIEKSGDLATAAAARAKAGDWTRLAKMDGTVWQALAAEVARSPQDAPDPAMSAATLEQGHALIEAGATTQAAVAALLKNAPQPTPVEQ